MNFGERMKLMLESKGMSQSVLARKSGITEVSISRYIKGDRVPNVKALKRIAEALECSVSDLLEEEESYEITPKGLACLALMQVGLITDINDSRADGFWTLFELSMKEKGYVKV